MGDLVAALADPAHQFDRADVAVLIAMAMQCGYEMRVDEENAAYPPLPVLTFGRWSDQADARRAWDAAVRAEAGG